MFTEALWGIAQAARALEHKSTVGDRKGGSLGVCSIKSWPNGLIFGVSFHPQPFYGLNLVWTASAPT